MVRKNKEYRKFMASLQQLIEDIKIINEVGYVCDDHPRFETIKKLFFMHGNTTLNIKNMKVGINL